MRKLLTRIGLATLGVLLVSSALDRHESARAVAQTLTAGGRVIPDSLSRYWEDGVIPDWLAYRDVPFVYVGGGDTTAVPSTDCPSSMEFELTSDNFASYFDESLSVSRLYVEDWRNDRILQHDIDGSLNRTESILPGVSHGRPWLAVDLDLDGNIELVVQRGDGSNGFLDILSAPNWTLRQRLTFTGMNVYMHPAALNMDDDPFLEMYATPLSLGGVGCAVVIDFDTLGNGFKVVDSVPTSDFTVGVSAVADFDSDGRVEMITGDRYGYWLFEYTPPVLTRITRIVDYGFSANNTDAVVVRPKPGGVVHALVGHSSGPTALGYYYQLLEPAGDNTFESVHVFQEFPPWSGQTPCYGVDVDCDGLDELVMLFFPRQKVWEWDPQSDTFALSCDWDAEATGTFIQYAGVDLDQNGVPEWGTLNHDHVFRAYPGLECINCDTTGRCWLGPEWCRCPCSGDPVCDGTRDISDVIRAVEVSFMEGVPQYSPRCPRPHTDVDCNGITDVLDVVHIVNVVFRSATPAIEFCEPCS